MGSDRCPSCAAAVRKDADWCTLCYADLRPAPAPVERVPYPRGSTPPSASTSGTDPLQAPYEHVLAAVYGGATSGIALGTQITEEIPPVTKPSGWPCTQCGDLNDFEKLTCGSCGAAFGAALRSTDPVPDRRKLMIYAVAAVIAFLCLVAALTFATTKRPKPTTGNDGGNRTETTGLAVPGPAIQHGGSGADPSAARLQ